MLSVSEQISMRSTATEFVQVHSSGVILLAITDNNFRLKHNLDLTIK
jgi:hypothetical protein